MSEVCWTVLFYLLLMKLTSHHAHSKIHLIIRRDQEEENIASNEDDKPVEGLMDAEELPEAEPISPGHSLIQPETGMLMSAVKYPQEEDKMLVYGNLDNLGIAYGKTSHRVLYTGFRRGNLLDALLKSTDIKYSNKPLLIYIRRKQDKLKNMNSEYGSKVSEEENNASEVVDDEFQDVNYDFRRHANSPDKYKYKERESSLDDEADTKETSGSSDYERNPGNPYTVFKDKYLQNWMWNHVLDGKHMNINPYAPEFTNMGPSGATLFFNRKWWYYNQDDFRPFD